MKKHLENISKIIIKFKKKYKFVEAYLDISGNVQSNVHSNIEVTCNREFDDFTLSKIKTIQGDLYKDIRKYLEDNKLQDTLYITTEYNGWAASNILLYFKTEFRI